MRQTLLKNNSEAASPLRPVNIVFKSRDRLVGRVIDDKYVLESLISKGGMGNVYCARRLAIGDLAAVKVLKTDDRFDPVSLKRFQFEAAAAASIKHQNVVNIFDFGLLDDIAYLVMERLEGPPLSDEINYFNPFSLERSIFIFKQISAAVHAAHRQGIIHRDLKPSNIIFQHPNCDEDLIKVVDFGIAKMVRTRGVERLTEAGSTVGTPTYMSPEQCLGKRSDERSDIYSLGIVLYEMLTGTVPFHDSTVSAILVQHAIKKPQSMTAINCNIPEQVDAVVMKALEKNPEKRYRSAIEMATEFELACRSASFAERREASEPNRSSQSDLSSIGLSSLSSIDHEALSLKEAEAPVTGEVRKVTSGISDPIRFSFERFIGRKEELKHIEDCFEKVKAGQGRSLFVTGDPGIGKTELINQFQRTLNPAAALFLSGKFYEYGSDGPYRPYLDGIYNFMRTFQEYGPEGWSTSDASGLIAQIKPTVDDIDSLINDNRKRSGTIEEKIKYRAFELLTKVFTTISKSFPVILFLDDVQWADPLGLEFLAYFIRNTENCRILILCTARSQEILDEDRPIKTWLRRICRYGNFDQIKLNPLSDIEARSLVDSIFGNIKIAEGVIRRFCEVTQGNPFYLVEILHQLIQERKISWTGERWQCAEIDEFELPGTILELVELRLKRLTEETIDVFTQAAVAGEKFSFQLLRAITGLSNDRLMDIIDIGLHELIIKESAPFAKEPNPEEPVGDYFIFCHSTLRKALYERLSGERRRMLHAQIGNKLERLNLRRLDRVASELAHHFHYGADHRKTLYYGAAAGEAARNIFAIEEALRYYSWAENSLLQMIEDGEPPDVEAEWMGNFRLSYGNVLMHLSKNDDARKQLDMAYELSFEAGFEPMQGKVLQSLGELSWSRGHYSDALEFCNAGLDLARRIEDIGRECRLLGVMGDAYFSQGEFDQAIEIENRSLELARQIGDSTGEGESLRRLGAIMGMRRQTKAALDCLEQALAIAQYVGNRQSEWLVMMLIGNVYIDLGELKVADEYYRRSLTVARAIGRRRGECRVTFNIGENYRQSGNYYDAKIFFKDAQTIAVEIQDPEIEGEALSNLGLIYKDLAEFDSALDCFQQALNIFREMHYCSNIYVEALSGIAEILLRKGEVIEAKDHFEAATAKGRELGLTARLIPSLRGLAACERKLGQTDAARQKLSEAINIIESLMAATPSDQESERYLQVSSELAEEQTVLEQEHANILAA